MVKRILLIICLLSIALFSGILQAQSKSTNVSWYQDNLRILGPDNQTSAIFNVQQKFDQKKTAIPISDPNSDPNNAIAEVTAFLQAGENPPSPAEPTESLNFWQSRYHPQVGPRIFAILNYPYYRGGREYSLTDPPTSAPDDENEEQIISDPQDPNDPVSSDEGAEPAQLNALSRALEKCCDLIHQWRTLNEAPATALEIVYSIELTRTSTGIYQTKPNLAVNVKRTIGLIGRRNRQFDQTSRMIFQDLLGGAIDKTLLGRLEKQISDLESLLDRLAEQNDAISMELGVGKINRQAANPKASEPIKFSRRK